MIGLEAEAYNIGVAAAGRANDIAPELLARHLRACYV
jgi:hypothetical protein